MPSRRFGVSALQSGPLCSRWKSAATSAAEIKSRGESPRASKCARTRRSISGSLSASSPVRISRRWPSDRLWMAGAGVRGCGLGCERVRLSTRRACLHCAQMVRPLGRKMHGNLFRSAMLCAPATEREAFARASGAEGRQRCEEARRIATALHARESVPGKRRGTVSPGAAASTRLVDFAANSGVRQSYEASGSCSRPAAEIRGLGLCAHARNVTVERPFRSFEHLFVQRTGTPLRPRGQDHG